MASQQPAGSNPRPGLIGRLARDDHRGLLGSLLPILPAAAIIFAFDNDDDRLAQFLTFALIYWTLWCTLQCILTYLIFGRCDASTFAQRIQSAESGRRRLWRVVLGIDEGAVSLATVLSVGMVVVTMFVFITPKLHRDTSVIAAAATSIVSSWMLTALSYAIDYARLDMRTKGLQFPGNEQLAFSDYLYYAICVNSTFATSDVTVVSSAMRRLTTTHTLVAFGFNTVIFALLITLLTGAR